MKTIYLKGTKTAIIKDIQKVASYSKSIIGDKEFESGYNGQVEYSDSNICVHYIGDIMLTPPTYNEKFEVITPPKFVGSEHCNVLVSEDFDESIFKTKTSEPNLPKHIFDL